MLLLSHGFSMELEARIWFAAPQRRYLRAMKTRPCAPGKINAPPRVTSQNISPAPFRLSLRRDQSFKSTDWKKKKRRSIELGSGFGRFLAAKIEFSYGAGQTVNLLALRLQWFESTPTQVFPRAILEVFKPFSGQLEISSPGDRGLVIIRRERGRSWKSSSSRLRDLLQGVGKYTGAPAEAVSRGPARISAERFPNESPDTSHPVMARPVTLFTGQWADLEL